MLDILLNILIYLITVIVILWVINLHIISRKCSSDVCLLGKTAIITGGSRGIGYETAVGLAARGCKVIIACRSKSDKIVEKIIKRTQNPNVVAKHLDLCSIASVRQFAREIHESETCIDILINNAGIGHSNLVQTEDGFNPVMQTNYFSHVLLTHLLIDLIKKSCDGRIVFLSSVLSYLNNLSLKSLNSIEKHTTFWDGVKWYGSVKTCIIIATVVLAEKLKNSNITVNVIHPGVVQTEIFATVQEVNINRMYLFLMYAVSYYFLKTPEEGAQPTLKTAVETSYKQYTGRFIWDFNWMPTPFCVRNKEFCKQVWEATEKYIGLSPQEKL